MTTVTESSDLLEDPIVQERLRPRNNSVTNALYDRYILHSMKFHPIQFLIRVGTLKEFLGTHSNCSGEIKAQKQQCSVTNALYDRYILHSMKFYPIQFLIRVGTLKVFLGICTCSICI